MYDCEYNCECESLPLRRRSIVGRVPDLLVSTALVNPMGAVPWFTYWMYFFLNYFVYLTVKG